MMLARLGREPSTRPPRPAFDWLQPFIEAPSTCLLLLQRIWRSSKSPVLVASLIDPSESAGIGLSERLRPPLFRLFYQAEIRHLQVPHRKIPNRLTAANSRDA